MPTWVAGFIVKTSSRFLCVEKSVFMDLSRLELLISDENIQKLKQKKICIIGLGGVGGYAFEALVRSGIEDFVLIDYDKIESSNLNRQILSTTANIGEYKVKEAVKRANLINPNIKIKEMIVKLKPEDIRILEKDNIDYLVDACDDIEVKKELIRFSVKENIALISSMGTGNKMHPEKLEIIELSKTSYDPIAKSLRKMVKEEKISKKIMVISSKEEKHVSHYKKIPSNSFVPAVAGLLCASYIINDVVRDVCEKN